MDHFTLLPHDLHRTLFNHYLLYREKMSLISCNTTFYGLYFKKERIITLSEINNYKFFYDLGFQQMVLEKIDSPLDQLIMYDHDFSFIFIKDHFFVPRLNGIKTLFIPIDDYVKLNELYPDCIPVVENLFLGPSNRFEFIEGERVLPFLNRAKKSIKFSSLRNLPVELTLSPTIEEVYFDNCNAINKLSSPLPNLRIMKLSQSCVQNLNDFNDLEELTFDEAQVSAMINHSTLSTARKLHFEKWKNLSDISFLQENEEIIISDCSQVTNYTNCFRKSKKITIDLTTASIAVDVDIDVDLSYYSKVEEFRLLGNGIVLTNGLATGIISPTLKHLDITGVCGITDLELFGHLKYISLINCPDITTLRGLEHVPSVTVKGLALTNLEGLGANKEVIISRCNHVTDFTPLKYVNRVNIESCEGFTNASHLDHVSNVTIFSCDQLEDVSGLRNAESVNLFLCPLITDFSPLKYVDSVKLVKCKGFTNASHLDHVSHVTIWYGDQLEDVSGLRNAELVELGICPLIKSIESLKDVKKLKVWGCELLNC